MFLSKNIDFAVLNFTGRLHTRLVLPLTQNYLSDAHFILYSLNNLELTKNNNYKYYYIIIKKLFKQCFVLLLEIIILVFIERFG